MTSQCQTCEGRGWVYFGATCQDCGTEWWHDYGGTSIPEGNDPSTDPVPVVNRQVVT